MKYVKFLVVAAMMLLGSCKPSIHKEKAVKIHEYHAKMKLRDSTHGAVPIASPVNTDMYYYIIWSDGGGSSNADSYRPGVNCYSYSSPVPVKDFSTVKFEYGQAKELEQLDIEEMNFDAVVNQQLDELEVSVQEAFNENPETVSEETVDVSDDSGATVSEEAGGNGESAGEGSSSEGDGGSSSGSDGGGDGGD